MRTADEQHLLSLLQACAGATPLYPKHYAAQANLNRDKIDEDFEELRRRGLVTLTEWVKDSGQGYALTEAGQKSIAAKRLLSNMPIAPSMKTGPVSLFERGEMVRDVFLDPPTPYVSRVLLAMNLLYFGYGAFVVTQENLPVSEYLQGSGRATNVALIKLGALHKNLVFADQIIADERPQFERILLCMFVHIGIFHLLMNMYFLFSIGPLIEAMWGGWRFLVIYFVAGLVSGCVILQIELWREKFVVTAGASGALYGMFAALLVWFLLNKRHLPTHFVQAWSRNLAINLVILIAISFVGGVSWQGHLGGAIGGALAALLLHVQRFHPYAIVRGMALAGVPLIPVVFFVALLWQAGRL